MVQSEMPSPVRLETCMPSSKSAPLTTKERSRRYREKAREEGRKTLSETWASRNLERHLENSRRWRSKNRERASEISKASDRKRRSTPWGAIDNRIISIIHDAIRNQRSGVNSKYCKALGYTWPDLKDHLERQFLPWMGWENWGREWEIDHIRPRSSFRYESIEDPTFRECWGLSNLRPLPRAENQAKRNRPPEGV